MNFKFERTSVILPFLVCSYAVLGLFARNASEVLIKNAFRPLLIAITVTLLIFGIAYLLTKNIHVASVITSICLILFFTYGHFYSEIKLIPSIGAILGHHRYLVTVWALIAFVLILLFVKRPSLAKPTGKYLSLVFSLLLVFSFIQIGYFLGQRTYYETTYESPKQTEILPSPNPGQPESQVNQTGTVQNEISLSPDVTPPDIYYIVLDAYGRSDVLKNVYGVDNSDFVDNLKKIGFFVASCSQSNYTRTILSLSTTLNMDYLEGLNPDLNLEDSSTAWLVPYIEHSKVQEMLANLGYKTIVFKNVHETLMPKDAEIVYKPVDFLTTITPFERLLFRTTLLRVWMDFNAKTTNRSGNEVERDQILYALEKLPEIPDIKGPKFVFVHLIIPHPPFVFGPKGEIVDIPPYDVAKGNIYTKEDYIRGYSGSVIYINRRLEKIIPQLIKKSDVPPVIVIAGDHGPDPIGGNQNSVRNLNAYYLPGRSELLYDQITPINTFRVIFNSYFNGKYELLPDKSYFSPDHNYFDLAEIQNDCR